MSRRTVSFAFRPPIARLGALSLALPLVLAGCVHMDNLSARISPSPQAAWAPSPGAATAAGVVTPALSSAARQIGSDAGQSLFVSPVVGLLL